jgi:predicted DNA-binding protein
MPLEKTLAVRLPSELDERLKRAAERDGRTPSNYLRRVLRQALNDANA